MEWLIYVLCLIQVILVFISFKILEENEKLKKELESLEEEYYGRNRKI